MYALKGEMQLARRAALRVQNKGIRVPCSHIPRRRQVQPVLASAAGTNVFSKIGRLLKEKTTADFERVFKGTEKTRERLGLVEELLTFWSLEDYESTLDELEDALIVADFGVKTASKVVDQIRAEIKLGKLKTGDDIRTALKGTIRQLLNTRGKSSELKLAGKPSIILVVGVNGAGKTTTIGKLAHKLGQEEAKVLLVPGDTFRAAAAEQLAEWAKRANAEMAPFKEGGKASGVIAQACNDAKQRKQFDVVVCDTAGRLHTAYGLMEQLKSCRQAIANVLPGQPDEVLLVLDGTTGLNMLNQAREFNDAVGLTGLILTKLDGSAKGGAVVAVVDELGIPVKFVGVGETIADLQAFNEEAFVDALFPQRK